MMISYNINEFRSGLKIIQDGEPCVIIDNEFVKPGKGQAFNRVRLRKLTSGKVLEKTFKSGDLVQAANITNINMIYIYQNREFWYFMNKKNFEQLAVSAKSVGNNTKWLTWHMECMLTLWDRQPITVTLPNFVELKVIGTDPGFKRDTTNACSKLAMLTTGAIVKVPLFIQIGEVIKVDIRSGEYVSRIR